MYLRFAARQTILVFMFTFLAALGAYVFRLVLARNLSVSDYGLFYSIFAFFGLFATFVDFGLTQSMAKFIVELNVKMKFSQIKTILLSGFFFQIITSLLISLIIIFLMFNTEVLLKYFDTSNKILVFLMVVWFVTIPIDIFLKSIFLGFQKANVVTSIDMSKSVILAILCILFFMLGLDVFTPFVAYALINILVLFIFFPFIFRIAPGVLSAPFEFKKITILPVFRYAVFIAFSSFAWLIITYTDSIMILFFRTTEEVGFYQIAIPLSYILLYFVNSLNLVVYPLFSKLKSLNLSDKIEEGASLAYTYAFVGLVPCALILISFPELIISFLFGAKFIPASSALQVLTIGTLFFSLASFNINLLNAVGHARKIAVISIIVALLNILFNSILIPLYGFLGAAYATTVSFFILFLFTLIQVLRVTNIRFPLFKWLLNIICGIIMVLFILNVKSVLDYNVYIETAVILLISITLYVLLILFFKIVKIKEIKDLLYSIIR